MMKELTDLEICTRIAEIEGVELFLTYNKVFDKRKLISLYMDNGVKWHHAAEIKECFFTKVYSVPSEFSKAQYNPLTGDALCFRLMVKYEVEAIPLVSGVNGRHSAIARVFNGQDDFIEFKAQSDTLNKAICLAIIKAHG